MARATLFHPDTDNDTSTLSRSLPSLKTGENDIPQRCDRRLKTEGGGERLSIIIVGNLYGPATHKLVSLRTKKVIREELERHEFMNGASNLHVKVKILESK